MQNGHGFRAVPVPPGAALSRALRHATLLQPKGADPRQMQCEAQHLVGEQTQRGARMDSLPAGSSMEAVPPPTLRKLRQCTQLLRSLRLL